MSKGSLILSEQEGTVLGGEKRQRGVGSFLKQRKEPCTNTGLGAGICRSKIFICYHKVQPGTQRERGKIPQRWKITQMINVGKWMDILGFI